MLGSEVPERNSVPALSPDLDHARVDWNRLSLVTFRGGREAAVTVKGRFQTGVLVLAVVFVIICVCVCVRVRVRVCMCLPLLLTLSRLMTVRRGCRWPAALLARRRRGEQ